MDPSDPGWLGNNNMPGVTIQQEDDSSSRSNTNGFPASSESEDDSSYTNGHTNVTNGAGIGSCEFCGRVGAKSTFYSKSKRFCTMGCSRSFSASQKEKKPPVSRISQGKKGKGIASKQQNRKVTGQYQRKDSVEERAFDLDEYLGQHFVQAAPVSCFKHCAMSDSWDAIGIGMKVEVINNDYELNNEVYWIASVIRLAGYKSLLRYEGFANDNSCDFWANLCNDDVHPVGYCALNGKPLVPPQTIQHKYVDWKDFLVKRLTGSRTLPQNFYTQVMSSFENHPIKVGMYVEVVDKNCVSAMRVATVEEIVGCRIRLKYHEPKGTFEEFWCHRESPLLHPVGWSQLVGHKIHATQAYKSESFTKVALKKFSATDTTPEMYPEVKEPPGGGAFHVGMKLETVDPLNLATICVATVTKVLRNNYLMIGIDGSLAENGSDWFCYHATSTSIFPVGFCEINGLELTPPRGHKGSFRWIDYLKEKNAVAAPVKLFQRDIPKHGFKVNMKVEAVDLMEPRLICIGTVVRVVGRLLRVHFDGWESDFDQWVDCESVDVYPVGWCHLVKYTLEGPRQGVSGNNGTVDNSSQMNNKKRKQKTQLTRGQRKYIKVESTVKVKDELTSPDLSPTTSISPLNTPPLSATATPSAAEDGMPDLVQPMSRAAQITSRSPCASVSAPGSMAMTSMAMTPVSRPMMTSPDKSNVNKTLSYSPTGGDTFTHIVTENIPRVLSGEPERDVVITGTLDKPLHPELWNNLDVCQFLRINDCGQHCESFNRKKIGGSEFLSLTKEQLVNFIGMKVGPSIKIHNLIKQLQTIMTAQAKKHVPVPVTAPVRTGPVPTTTPVRTSIAGATPGAIPVRTTNAVGALPRAPPILTSGTTVVTRAVVSHTPSIVNHASSISVSPAHRTPAAQSQVPSQLQQVLLTSPGPATNFSTINTTAERDGQL